MIRLDLLVDRLYGRKVVDHNIKTNGDAARAVATLGQTLIKQGFDGNDVRQLITHELDHALADPTKYNSPAKLTYRANHRERTYEANYTIFYADPIDCYLIATAPERSNRSTEKMSEGDTRLALTALMKMQLDCKVST